MSKKIFFAGFFCIFLGYMANAQTMHDTIYAKYTLSPVAIDGSGKDGCWATAVWHPINQVWIPFGEVMKAGDFSGRFKAAWDTNYLYILAEIEDNIISDDHANPLDNWWNDDCLELFIDEDRSKGNHECNYNAFAYHVSLYRDAIDMGTNCAGINLKNNMTVVMDTIGQHLYLWELAVKMYNSGFNPNNPEASRVKLYPNKLMGFSIAYCDNDETTSRENFIGSMVMTEATANESYKNADYFGPMLLVDPDNELASEPVISAGEQHFIFYPNPVSNILTVMPGGQPTGGAMLEVISMAGTVVEKVEISGQRQAINLSWLANGIYSIRITGSNFIQTGIFSKQ
jgi:hypothetical protein